MSVEAAVYDILVKTSAVTAIVGTRIYPVTIPQGKTGSAVVFQQITSMVEDTTEGQESLRTDTIQVTCWSAQAGSPDDARTLSEAVRTAMQAASGSHGGVTVHSCLINGEGDVFDLGIENERLARYGKRQDWEITFR